MRSNSQRSCSSLYESPTTFIRNFLTEHDLVQLSRYRAGHDVQDQKLGKVVGDSYKDEHERCELLRTGMLWSETADYQAALMSEDFRLAYIHGISKDGTKILEISEDDDAFKAAQNDRCTLALSRKILWKLAISKAQVCVHIAYYKGSICVREIYRDEDYEKKLLFAAKTWWSECIERGNFSKYDIFEIRTSKSYDYRIFFMNRDKFSARNERMDTAKCKLGL